MNELRDWREWRESVDRALADVLRRVEALERRTEPEELIKVVMSAPLNTVSVTEQPVNVIDPVPQMLNDNLFRVGEPFALTYQSPEDAPTIVESSP